jgi:hypothetical protein
VVESFKAGVTINGFKWFAGTYAEFTATPGGINRRIGKVVLFFRVTVPSHYPYPLVLQLVILKPCRVGETEYGTQTLDIHNERAPLLVGLEDVLCRIHVADHRTDPLLRSGIRAGNTRT